MTKQQTLNQMAAEAQYVLKTTCIDLNAFLALKGTDRAARWRQFDHGAKFQAVALMIERRGYDWEVAEVEAWIAKYDATWEVASAETDLAIPPASDILALVEDRRQLAAHHEDTAGVRQLDRVSLNLIKGARLAWHYGRLLISSVNHPGSVYAASSRGCTCPNGAAGQASCWHVALHDILLDLREEAATTADHAADRAAAALEAEQERAAAAQLGRRLAEARQRLYLAA